MSKIVDIIGMKFGRLTVVERCEDHIQPSGQHIPYYLCKCDCEKDKFVKVRGANLRNGTTKSCGCLRKEVCSKRKGCNQYDFYDDYVIGYTSNGEPFIFDVEDYEKIKGIHWYINKSGYVVSTIYRQHRLIMDCPDNMIVDHINHNKADNRKCNLRITTKSENSRNVALRKNNKSGVTGVYWSNHFNKWIAKIMIDKKESTLGMFDVFEEAARQLNVAPDHCIVVEDSPNGVFAAKAAGCFTIMVPEMTFSKEMAKEKYDVCLRNMYAVQEYIQEVWK